MVKYLTFSSLFRSTQKNEHRVDAVISCPPRDINSPDGAHSWQRQEQHQQQQQHYVAEHHRQQQQPQYFNPQQERVVQELQQHIQHHNMQQQQQQQQQQQNRHQFQFQDNCRSLQFSGPSLPTTLGSVSTGIGRTGVIPHPNSGYPSLHNHPTMPSTPPMPPQRSAPLTSPRTHLRETTKDIVTAVAHSDINGMSSAVNTVALKDIDIQMTALSGYETYV
jgi:TolA-binding protein